MTLTTLSESRAFGGVQGVYKHRSQQTGTDMTFAVYLPEDAPDTGFPVLWFLSGLTCSHANVMEKGEYRQACAEHKIAFIAPDTSPRGDSVPDAPDEYDFGIGAGFYLDALCDPWRRHYRMRSYIERELSELIAANFPINMSRQSISGHSMGGHGALTIALRNPERFRSVSAFAPIVAPGEVEWGRKAFNRYLDKDPSLWREYDAVALIEDGARLPELLVHQGTADAFLDDQLQTHRLAEICRETGIRADVRMIDGYDHSYFFVSTFMQEHVRWHAERLYRL